MEFDQEGDSNTGIQELLCQMQLSIKQPDCLQETGLNELKEVINKYLELFALSLKVYNVTHVRYTKAYIIY